MTDPLHDIRHYSPTLTISQVVQFCAKKGLPLTRPMIQNYIRDGLLPPPVNKRFYTHKHLAALVMISRLKAVYDIPAIKAALFPHMDAEGLPLEMYRWLMDRQKEVHTVWLEKVAPGIAAEAEDRQSLLIMAHVAGIRDLVEL